MRGSEVVDCRGRLVRWERTGRAEGVSFPTMSTGVGCFSSSCCTFSNVEDAVLVLKVSIWMFRSFPARSLSLLAGASNPLAVFDLVKAPLISSILLDTRATRAFPPHTSYHTVSIPEITINNGKYHNALYNIPAPPVAVTIARVSGSVIARSES